MFEHVGPPQYQTFFRKCRDLLTDDGVMLLHTIGRMGGPGVTDDFTAKYIFPGGYNPALSEIVRGYEGLRLFPTDVEVLRLHYALTLDHWYDRTVAAKDAIVALYDERFYRMWTFYLAGAAAAFRPWRAGATTRCSSSRSRPTLPLTRDYMVEGEQALREADRHLRACRQGSRVADAMRRLPWIPGRARDDEGPTARAFFAAARSSPPILPSPFGVVFRLKVAASSACASGWVTLPSLFLSAGRTTGRRAAWRGPDRDGPARLHLPDPRLHLGAGEHAVLVGVGRGELGLELGRGGGAGFLGDGRGGEARERGKREDGADHARPLPARP